MLLPLLQVKDLSVSFTNDSEQVQVVKNISFNLHAGKFTAIVGESGSGKSVTALSMLQLLPPAASLSGQMLFTSAQQKPVNLLKSSFDEIRKIRGNSIAMIFQEPMTSLNPVFSCGSQVMESLLLHKKLSKKAAKQKTLELFEQVELPNPTAMFNRYPHQISGGQKQRVMIAMAMSCSPSLLIADEPTTALDVRVQKNILELLRKLQVQQQLSVLFITHDLGLVSAFADEVLVMHKGVIVEQGLSKDVLRNPQHSYTKALLACKPHKNSKGTRLPVVADFLNNATFPASNIQSITATPAAKSEVPVLQVENLKVYFTAATNVLGKATAFYKAVDDVSFTVQQGETVGLVGESGCGKTTLGRTILQLVKPTAGKILLHGKAIQHSSGEAIRQLRKDLQIVFQDPYGSLNPRISIGEAILEPLMVHRLHATKKAGKEKVIELLEHVNMNADAYNRYPHQFSGGQRQRICIARALGLEPSFLIFDESVSALDVSVQAQVLNLINDLKRQYQFTSIFISHDLSVVHYISDRILVMNKGKIVEEGLADQILKNPQQPYTQALIEAIP
ncbi:MAG: ABC transporter ATP-binding protein [Chitinophagaceae bacterium]|nr:MAG: ABC transporter ATP-binding protein [Chitinophagaceae bacterium]